MLNFIVNYWWILVILIATITIAVISIVRFIRTPTTEQLTKVKSWLLLAVTEAEKQFHSGTGSVKLAFCYDAFVAKFPTIALVISFEQFSDMVDEVLDKFRVMLESNASLQEYVNGKEVQE